jgi:hypothetical protein
MVHRNWDDEPEPLIPFLTILMVIVVILLFL